MLSLYLFVGRERSLLLDVGVDETAKKGLMPYLAGIGLEPASIRWAVVSHADVDHFGGIASLRELSPDVVCLAHRLDAPLITDYAAYETRRARGFREPWGLDESPEVLAWTRSVTREGPVNMTVTGGETVDLGGGWELEIVHVPGHTHGHLAVYDPRSRTLAVADAVLRDMELLLTAHYPTMRGDAAPEFLARSRGFVEKVDAVVVDELDAAGSLGLRLQQLLPRANPRLGSWPSEGTEGALAFPVVGHLERLLALGRITAWQATDGYRVRSNR